MVWGKLLEFQEREQYWLASSFCTDISDHSALTLKTEDYYKKQRTVNDHCNRLKEMITWVQQHYPDYYSQGVIELTVEQKSNKRRYHNCTYDFLYETINVKITKLFLATTNTTQQSWQGMKKGPLLFFSSGEILQCRHFLCLQSKGTTSIEIWN